MKALLRCALLLVFFVILIICFSASACAESGTSGQCSWTLDGGVLTISGHGGMGRIRSHSGDAWRAYKDRITDVIIEQGVTGITSYAFQDFSNLSRVSIPNSITAIGSQAFLSCSSLQNVELPRGVTSIYSEAFYGCVSLVTIEIPDTVNYIEHSAFALCRGLKSVTLPEGLTTIDSGVFGGCSSLTSVNIPRSVIRIEEQAFQGCESLKCIEFPESLSSISSSAFSECKSLISISIPKGITTIYGNTFYGCSDLKYVSLPYGLTDIYNYAFNYCNITDVFYTGTEEQWKSISFHLGNESLTNATIHYYAQPDLILPASLEAISEEAFAGGAFRYVKLSEHTGSIGPFAFASCANLKYIYIPNETTTIDKNAFGDIQELVIFGKAGSTADDYAYDHDFVFIPIS